MVTPSAPSLHRIGFGYSSSVFKKAIAHLSREEENQLCDATDEMLKDLGNLREVDLNFFDGTVTIEVEYINGYTRNLERGEVVIDILARKFFEDNKEYIKELHPDFADRIWKSTYKVYKPDHTQEDKYCVDDIRTISNLFYRAYERFEEYHSDGGVLDSRMEDCLMSNLKSGFKSYKVGEPETVGSWDILTGEMGEKFKKFIQSFPASLLSKKDHEKAMLFLKSGVEHIFLKDREDREAGVVCQKTPFEKQVSYLKKVIFLLHFQDLFKGILEEMYETAMAEKNKLRGYIGTDVAAERRHFQIRMDLLKRTLSEFPISDLSLLIPLAFRSSPEELSPYDEAFDKFSLIPDNYIELECSNAIKADKVIRDLLQKRFPEDFSLEKSVNNEGVLSINRYLMGLSGLTFSQGLMGRVTMHHHRVDTYAFEEGFSMLPLRDNILMEFLMEAAHRSSCGNYNWIKERFLAHVTYMMGRVSRDEIRVIESAMDKLSQIVDQLPVAEALLKKKSRSSDEYVLRNSAREKLYSLCKMVRERAKLPPLHRETCSSCTIM